MNYQIENILSQDQSDILTSLIGHKIHDIYALQSGELYLEIILVIEDSIIRIKNLPVAQADHDEYPQFQIAKEMQLPNDISEFTRMPIEQNINSILLTNDIAYWEFEENTWSVKSDIAIEFVLARKKIAFVLLDSLAGFLKMYLHDTLDQPLPLDEYYDMKSDSPDISRKKTKLLS